MQSQIVEPVDLKKCRPLEIRGLISHHLRGSIATRHSLLLERTNFLELVDGFRQFLLCRFFVFLFELEAKDFVTLNGTLAEVPI